jgi:diguanylate cyclase (GGDEF)-like protein
LRRVREDISILVLSGPAAGQYHRIPKDGGTIGRDPDQADIAIADPGISPKHARIERDQPQRFVVIDLDSRYGVYVEGDMVREQALRDGDRVQISGETVLRVRYQDPKETELLDKLQEAAIRDPLTSLANRRHFHERLDQELGYARRHGTPVTLLLLDIDFFKRINDEHGEAVGDEVLRAVARVLQGLVRIEDLLARYGGDELVVLSRGYDLPSGELFAERLRKAIREKPIRVGARAQKSFQISFSIGVASFHHGNVEGPMQLIARADSALYRAKHLGRDRHASWTNP